MLKPDNFRYPSSRPGNIIDILSTSGLRIVGCKKFRMSVAQAVEFYGPVRDALARKFKDIGYERLCRVVGQEFGFDVPDEVAGDLCGRLGPLFATAQFEDIVRFMTGYKPGEVSESHRNDPGRENALALVYEGVNAVEIIRGILGTTDPSKARPGSVRREYGSNIMVNAAHASDSPESARREMGIIHPEEDTVSPLVVRHYGNVFKRLASHRLVQKLNPFRYGGGKRPA
jgi:nucleoside diphosphate kinase